VLGHNLARQETSATAGYGSTEQASACYGWRTDNGDLAALVFQVQLVLGDDYAMPR
jgi:hypothetical protein